MTEPRIARRKISAGVILIDREGRVLLQLRDDDPKIMFPNHWGITGGAGKPGETPDVTARREVAEETGMQLENIEPFRAYYFQETQAPGGARAGAKRNSADYELYLFHAPCETPVEEMVCGEGRELRFFAPEQVAEIDVAYNHRDVLDEFFGSAAYAHYLQGIPFRDGRDIPEPLEIFMCALDAGEPWFDALMRAIALWQRPQETVDGRRYRYLVGGEAFDWLLLAERILDAAGGRMPDAEVERLLFHGRVPEDGTIADDGARVDDAGLREMIGDTKHRAHLNYLYGVVVEEALQYSVELEVSKERLTLHMPDRRADDATHDPVYARIYGRTRADLLAQFRDEHGLPDGPQISLGDLREFMYWLFKYRVKTSEPARVASDTRKALAQLSSMEAAVRRSRRRAETPTFPQSEEVLEHAL